MQSTQNFRQKEVIRSEPRHAGCHNRNIPPFREHSFPFIPSSPPATCRWDCRRLRAPSSCDSSRLQARVSPGKSRRGAAQPPISSAWSPSQPKLPWPALSAAPCAPAWQPRAAESLWKDFLVPGGKRGLAGVVSVGYFIVFFAVSGRTVCAFANGKFAPSQKRGCSVEEPPIHSSPPPVVISLPLQAGHGAVPSPKGGAVPLDSCQRAAASSESCQLSLTFL